MRRACVRPAIGSRFTVRPGATLALLFSLTITAPCEASYLSRIAGVNIKLVPSATMAHAAQQPAQPMAPVAPPPSASAPVVVVSDSERQRLIDSIQSVQQTAQANATRNGDIVLDMVIAAIVLGAAASVAGFCKAGRLSGILSVLATATVGANNVLPFREDAGTFKFVAAQAQVLLLNVNLGPALTESQFQSLTQKLSYLVTYGDQDPSSASPEQLSQLLQQFHSA